ETEEPTTHLDRRDPSSPPPVFFFPARSVFLEDRLERIVAILPGFGRCLDQPLPDPGLLALGKEVLDLMGPPLQRVQQPGLPTDVQDRRPRVDVRVHDRLAVLFVTLDPD